MTELRWWLPATRRDGTSAHQRVSFVVECLALVHSHRHDLAFIGTRETRGLEPANRRRLTGLRDDLQRMLDGAVAAAIDEGTFTTTNPRGAGRAISAMCLVGPVTSGDRAADPGADRGRLRAIRPRSPGLSSRPASPHRSPR